MELGPAGKEQACPAQWCAAWLKPALYHGLAMKEDMLLVKGNAPLVLLSLPLLSSSLQACTHIGHGRRVNNLVACLQGFC